MPDKNICLGDVVQFFFFSSISTKTLVVSGRIYGKIDRAYAAFIGLGTTNWYIMLPDESSRTIAEEALDSMPAPGEVPPLEWGRIPSGSFLYVDEGSTDRIYDDAWARVFDKKKLCPRCGDRGYWRAMALFCEFHGKFWPK